MTATLSITASAVLTAVGNFLTGILPAGVSVVVGQVNRVATPIGPDYVVMTPLGRVRLATNIDAWDFGAVAPTTITSTASTQATVQLDVHGPNAEDNCQIISTLFRDDYAVQVMAGASVSPLYASDPRQMPFINGEKQYEDRWTIDLNMQVNPVVTVLQQFADQADVGLINVDAEYR